MKKITSFVVESFLNRYGHEGFMSLLLEGSARIQHMEDLIFWEGSKGALNALKSVEDLQKGGYKNLTVKWDGSPAVVFGRNLHGQFVLTDKSGFAAKGYQGKVTSADMLYQMFLNRPSAMGTEKVEYLKFADSMKSIFPIIEKATPTGLRGYYKGDLLYFNTPNIVNGRFVFKPNIVTYSIDVNSDLGRRIARSKVGIVVHRFVTEDGAESAAVGLDKFAHGGLLIVPPVSVQTPPRIDLQKIRRLQSLITSNASKIDSLLNTTVLSNMKVSDFPDILYTYTNSKVDVGLANLGKDFLKWLQTSKISDNKKKKIAEYVQQNEGTFNVLWEVVSQIMNVKDDIVDQLDAQSSDVKSSIGSVSGGEGYVMSSKYGDIKLVKRSSFSAANRAMRRESLTEGGEVFKNREGVPVTTKITRLDVIPTIKWLESITGLNLIDNMLGSAGKKEVSSDLDLLIDETKLSKDGLIQILSKWVTENNLIPKDFIKKSGISVHFKTPIKGYIKNGFVQTDFMFSPDPTWLKWSMAGSSAESSYKGVHRAILLSSIAKYRGLKWSFQRGLLNRETEEVITKNPDEIAKILLGKDASAKDLIDVESIINKIKDSPVYIKMTAEAKDTLKKSYNVDIP